MKDFRFYIAIFCAVITAVFMSVVQKAPISIGLVLILFIVIIFFIKETVKNYAKLYLFASVGVLIFIVMYAILLMVFKDNELITKILLYPSTTLY